MSGEEIVLKPFHESIVPIINTAEVGAMQTLAYLIRETKIPKNHDAIIAMWQQRIGQVGLNSDLGVVESLKAQKQAAEEVEAKKKAETT